MSFESVLLEEKLLSVYREKKLMLATAESCTGGMIGQRITNVSGSSEIYAGGVISYTNEVKMKLLSVSADTLEKYGAVSEETAVEMAVGARRALEADVAVSVTGIAGPTGGTAEKPVGTVCFGVCTASGVRSRKMHFGSTKTRE